jgi:hypothetical protein
VARHVLGGGSSLQEAGGTGEKADLVDHNRDFLGHGDREWLAGVLAFNPDELLCPRLYCVGNAEQREATFGRRRAFPLTKSVLRRKKCSLDILGRRYRCLGENLPRARVYERRGLGSLGSDVFPVDEIP